MISRRACICILIALFCPPAGLIASLICIYDDFECWKIYIAIIALAMGIFAYYYEPTIECDLTRYYAVVKRMIGHTYDESLKIAKESLLFGEDPLYSFILLCWGVAGTGDVHFLPMISTACVYYIGMYITFRYSQDEVEEKGCAVQYLYFILLAVNFFAIVNNVRNMLAFALIGLAIFRDCYLKKRNLITLLIYLSGLYMHLSGVVLIILRFVVPFSKKLKLPILIAGLLVPTVITTLSSMLRGVNPSNPVLNRLVNLINSGSIYYTHADAGWAVTVANSGAQQSFKILYITFAIAVVVLYFLFCRYLNETTDEKTLEIGKKSYSIDFTFLCSVYAIACAPMVMPEYWRFGCTAILCGGGLYAQTPVFMCKNDRLVRCGYFVFAFGMFALWFRNLTLYSDVVIGVTRSFVSGPLVSLILFGFDTSILSLISI